MSFNPDALKSTGQKKEAPRQKAVRLFLHVTDYETPDNGFHYAVGHNFDNPDQVVRVRLNTVEERIQDRPNVNPDKIRTQYVTGENTRDKLADKKKAGIKLLAFDDATFLSNKEGVSEYRAHWSQTISTDPSAEIMSGMAHIRLREANDSSNSAQAFVEVIKDAKIADHSIRAALTSMVDIKDPEGRGRDPFVMLRIKYNDKIYGTARLYPAMGNKTVFDQDLGSNKEVAVKLDGKSTLDKIMSGEQIGNPGGYVDRQADLVRAMIAGLEGTEEPKFNDHAMIERNRNIYAGVKEGHLVIEVLPCEKIEFGPDSRKTYLNDKCKVGRFQLQGYDLRKEQEGQRVSVSNGYTETVVGFQRHPDGTPYAVYASPIATFPDHLPLSDIKTEAVAQPESSAVLGVDEPAVDSKKKIKAEKSVEIDTPSM